MHKKTHYLVLALTLILALFMLNGCQEKNQEQTIGEVNGEAITEKQFEQHYRLVLNYYEQTYGKIDEKTRWLSKLHLSSLLVYS
jgi:Skp family chaperone for outer membrane proteins